MTAAALARTTAPAAPSLAGDGVLLPLAGGEARELRFSSRNICKVENTFGSHVDFLIELDRIPVNTLGWLLIHCCDVKTEAESLDLLDGTNWRELTALVQTAWDRAMPPLPASGEAPEGADPTQGP